MNAMASANGLLENKILNALWQIEEESSNKDNITAADVLEKLNASFEKRAYTTIKTVMDRLAVKKILLRRKCGRKFCYTSVCSRKELAQEAVQEVVSRYFNGDVRGLMRMLEEQCLTSRK